MQDRKVFEQKNLVLQVNPNYDPQKLDLDSWEMFLNRLCGDREYQKEAIKNSVIFLASGRYKNTFDLVKENYEKNSELQAKYTTIRDYENHLQLPNKLFANIDLATGTGKSYVIYGVAQIMLGLGLVERVLVLCPSLTIEAGLMEKFEGLSGDSQIKASIPDNAKYKNPSIVDANVTIKKGDICVENIHAVFERTGSSIQDSLQGKGENTLVLNDESHHIFNKISGNTNEARGLKKWKEFLLKGDYNFKYILGFTGTSYYENEYFNDIIYRYSLREAIEARIVKNIEYVQKDDSTGIQEKFQKIYHNHLYNIDQYPKVKPLSILITKDINKAKHLRNDLVDFLEEKTGKNRDLIEEKVLIVTSHKDHKANLPKLKYVDEKEDPTEWIISVSMLTEGWDVKNVFQIVPWEDKAFNSKLLIAQVLGRGLRIPEAYTTPQPKVIVFNHDAWSRNIKGLVDEILEIETKITSEVIKEGGRAKYNFSIYHLDYTKEEKEVEHNRKEENLNFSRLEKEGIKLDSQVIEDEKSTSYETIATNRVRDVNYVIEYGTESIDEVVDKLFDAFNTMEWEGKTLQLSEDQYTKNNLPPREKIKDIIVFSMRKVGNKGERIVKRNVHKILNSFAPLIRKKSKTIISETKVNAPFEIDTTKIDRENCGIGNFKRDHSMFYTNDWESDIKNEEQKNIVHELIKDENLPRKALKEQNEFIFKTPLNIVFSSSKPERDFIDQLCKNDNVSLIDSWIKSRDTNFYSIKYSLKYGGKDSKTRTHRIKSFNPDFFIKISKNDIEYILVVETKADKDDSEKNKAKYKYALEHFENLNKKLEENNINQKCIFHFLSPNGYTAFFEHLKNGTLLEGQSSFRCELENLLAPE